MDIADKDNKCSFECPVTGVDERVSLCVFKRNRAYRGFGAGENTCSCAIESGKCVIAKLMQTRKDQELEKFTSSVEKKIRVPEWLASAVACIVVLETTIGKYPSISEGNKERLRNVTLAGDVQKGKIKIAAKNTKTAQALNDSM